jgi:hypothetical protein
MSRGLAPLSSDVLAADLPKVVSVNGKGDRQGKQLGAAQESPEE